MLTPPCRRARDAIFGKRGAFSVAFFGDGEHQRGERILDVPFSSSSRSASFSASLAMTSKSGWTASMLTT